VVDRYGGGLLNLSATPIHAWAAGFFQGEGTILIGTHGRVTIEVEQMESAPLHLLQDQFGGTITARKDRPGVWRWRLGAQAHVDIFLTTIHDSLVGSKHEQAHVARNRICGLLTVEQARRQLHCLKGPAYNDLRSR